MKNKYYKAYLFINRVVFMIFGAALASIGLEIFLIPNNIVDGGVVGISIMSSYFYKTAYRYVYNNFKSTFFHYWI